MTTETLSYRSHRVELSSYASGWKALIYPPGDILHLPDTPTSLHIDGRNAVMLEAQRIIDQRISVIKARE